MASSNSEDVFAELIGRPMAPPLSRAGDALDALRQTQLLSAAQLKELTLAVQQGKIADARGVAKLLVQRGWLTAFQANQLLRGCARDLVLGPYLVLERLGEGGMGQVFKARHQHMQRNIALKVIRRELVGDAEAVSRFYREIQVISQLAHPNLVQAHDAGPVGSSHFLAMEFVEGTDLQELVRQQGPLPVARACSYIAQAALGLQHIHEHGLVHRDIKPSNLLVSKSPASGPGSKATGPMPAAGHVGVLKVLDLGLAGLQERAHEQSTTRLPDGSTVASLTLDKSFTLGTVEYLAPEQAIDFHSADIRADIYALGCTLFYLLAGQPPFASGTLGEKLMKHQQAEPPVDRLPAQVPAGLRNVLRKMLAKKPANRQATPEQVATALLPYYRPSATDKLAARVAAPGSRRWLLTGLAGMLLLGCLVSSVALALLRSRSEETLKAVAGVAPTTVPSVRPPAPTSEKGAVKLSTVAAFRQHFQAETPRTGWRYLWNERGPIGTPANYRALRWDNGSAYTVSGMQVPDPGPGGSLYLSRGDGHPGNGTAENSIDRYVIAAYVIQSTDGAGVYHLINTSITRPESRGNGIELGIHVNGNAALVRKLVPAGTTTSANFDVKLGTLKPTDAVYVCVGPNGHAGQDIFRNFDFTIAREP